jgi:hypothetical protein
MIDVGFTRRWDFAAILDIQRWNSKAQGKIAKSYS